ncbi:MAG TPA: phospholipase D-like domain-containing protein [Burkholderiales bacterium]|nr:phospholipase D-like domain-containing protein [Burkholderiales bacterium]
MERFETGTSQPFDLMTELQTLRLAADQALSRTAGAPLTGGNHVRVLRDAAENYPAWLAAIRAAERSVLFECYIFRDDEVGREFVAALVERARAGVAVRVIYDWLGTSGARSLFRPLVDAGGEVRCFNPPRFDSPLGLLTRDHRKMIAVDGRVGFVTGLCVSAKWLGDPRRRLEAWRDTGVEIRGPAVPQLERAFGQVWEAIGDPLPEAALTAVGTVPAEGSVALRVIASAPNTARVFRLDQLIAARARERLWLTDAYYVGVTPYVHALCAAANDGVDVRLLVPGASDIPVVSRLSRAGYRTLLESGVRVFEWTGSMLHAKTAIADRRWARVGSTNLNFASFLANYELDVALEDEAVVDEMARTYEADLGRADEIVLSRRHRARRSGVAAPRGERTRRALSGSAGRAAAGALTVGAAVGAALTNRRVLGPAEASLLATTGAILLLVAVVGVLWPPLLAWPLALFAAWIAVVMLLRARRLRRLRGHPPNVEI